MAPGGTERKQPRRKQQSGAKQVGLPPEVIEKRIKRYLDELERTNYTEPTISLVGISYGEGGMSARGRARETISDKRVVEGVTRKKTQSKAVRDALVYRKNLSTLIEESGISRLPPTVPTYLTAVAPPPIEPARLLCSYIYSPNKRLPISREIRKPECLKKPLPTSLTVG